MAPDDIITIASQLSEVKLENKIRWEEHEVRSMDMRKSIDEKFGGIKADIQDLKTEFRKLRETMPCKTHMEKFNYYDKAIALLTVAMSLIVGWLIYVAVELSK